MDMDNLDGRSKFFYDYAEFLQRIKDTYDRNSAETKGTFWNISTGLKVPLLSKCNADGVNAFHLDAMVWERVALLLTNSDLIRKQADIWLKKNKEHKDVEKVNKEKSENELKRLHEEEKRYLKVYGSGLVSFEQLKSQLKEIKERTEVIKEELELASAVNIQPTFDLSRVDDLSQKASQVIQSLTLDEKRLFLQKIIGSVTIGNGNKVFIKGGIPLESEAQNAWLWYTDRDSRPSKRRKKHAV